MAHHVNNRSALGAGGLLDDQVADYTDGIRTEIEALQVDSLPRSYAMGTPGNDPKRLDKLEPTGLQEPCDIDNDYDDMNKAG